MLALRWRAPFVALVAVLWLVGVAATVRVGLAAVPGDSQPGLAYGPVNVGVTATAIPAAPMGSRNALALVNLGPNTIYCGGDAAVTAATGFPIATGGVLGIDVGYDGQKVRPAIHCITSVLQVSPLNTRWMEVK